MTKGETYRHVHYLHDYALVNGCQFFCYDVVCKYWSFAEDLSKANSEFKPHTENMQPFLSRWHGKTHAWYCQVKLFKCQFITFRLITLLQILYSGHWMKGAGLTTGETTEQSNAKMARYGSSTKHMSRASQSEINSSLKLFCHVFSFSYNVDRLDHLTLAMIYYNTEKEERMPMLLQKMLKTVN